MWIGYPAVIVIDDKPFTADGDGAFDLFIVFSSTKKGLVAFMRELVFKINVTNTGLPSYKPDG